MKVSEISDKDLEDLGPAFCPICHQGDGLTEKGTTIFMALVQAELGRRRQRKRYFIEKRNGRGAGFETPLHVEGAPVQLRPDEKLVVYVLLDPEE